MRSYQPHRRRASWTSWLVGGSVLSLLLCGGIVGTLWLLGVNLNPFDQQPGEDPFMVRIPINAQPIPAYSRVEREHLLMPSTGGLAYQRVPPRATVGMSIVGVDAEGSHIEDRVADIKNVQDEVVFITSDGREIRQAQTFQLGGAFMNVNTILGRVVKRDKRAGMGFQETTFFPQGTPEGLAGATPEGMRAITLDATKLTGVHALNAGDRIDLMASVSSDQEPSLSLNIPGQTSAGRPSKEFSSEPVMLAQNALVLKPVYVRNEASTSASLTQGTRIQNVPKYEVAIAVAADDVIPLQGAINRSSKITCITHSMRPEDSGKPVVLVTQPDMVQVPVTARAIFAYDVISRDAFVSLATRALRTEPLSRQQVGRLGVITSLDDALGAIARHDIPAGRYLRHSDLLTGPPESHPLPTEQGATISAGIDRRNSGHETGQTLVAAATETQSSMSKPPSLSKPRVESDAETSVAAGLGTEHPYRETEHSGPEHWEPEHSGPEHSGPEHSGPEHRGPEHWGPEHWGPEHWGPEHWGPEQQVSDLDGREGFVTLLQPAPSSAQRATAVGDRPALTRFIPPGRTAFAVPWNRLYGGEHLQIGDRIDLLASYALSPNRREQETETRPDGTVIVRESESLAPRTTERTWDESFGFRGEPWFVASDALVIAPVGFPAPASALRELGDDLGRGGVRGSDSSMEGPPVIIAVQDRDVEAVAAVLVTPDSLLSIAFHAAADSPADTPPGMKRVVVMPQPVAPYEALAEGLWKGNRRRIISRLVSETDPSFAGAILVDDIQAYWGRVFAIPKSVGDSVKVDDFLPAGVKPGLAAAVRDGHTLFAVADREIEGLDNFATEDRIAILRRGMVKPPDGVEVLGVNLERTIATVVVSDVRLVRSSRAGQTVLELRNEDLTRLQASIARWLTDRDDSDDSDRSHLVAVAQPRADQSFGSDRSDRPTSATIPSYDPLSEARFTEVIVGRDRKVYGFSGSGVAATVGGGR